MLPATARPQAGARCPLLVYHAQAPASPSSSSDAGDTAPSLLSPSLPGARRVAVGRGRARIAGRKLDADKQVHPAGGLIEAPWLATSRHGASITHRFGRGRLRRCRTPTSSAAMTTTTATRRRRRRPRPPPFPPRRGGRRRLAPPPPPGPPGPAAAAPPPGRRWGRGRWCRPGRRSRPASV